MTKSSGSPTREGLLTVERGASSAMRFRALQSESCSSRAPTSCSMRLLPLYLDNQLLRSLQGGGRPVNWPAG